MTSKLLKDITPENAGRMPALRGEATGAGRMPAVPGLGLIILNRTQVDAGDHAQVGAQLTALYRAAQDAELAILRFGAAFWWAEENCAHLHSFTAGGPGRGKKGGFADWLRRHAPEVERTKAIRLRELAKAIAEHHQLGGAAETVSLLETDPATLAPADQAKREEVRAFVAEKSVRALQLELGLTGSAEDAEADGGGADDDDEPSPGAKRAGEAGRAATAGKPRAPIQHARNVRDAVTSLVIALPHACKGKEAEAYEDFRAEIEAKWRKVMELLPPRLLQISTRVLRARKATGEETE